MAPIKWWMRSSPGRRSPRSWCRRQSWAEAHLWRWRSGSAGSSRAGKTAPPGIPPPVANGKVRPVRSTLETKQQQQIINQIYDFFFLLQPNANILFEMYRAQPTIFNDRCVVGYSSADTSTTSGDEEEEKETTREDRDKEPCCVVIKKKIGARERIFFFFASRLHHSKRGDQQEPYDYLEGTEPQLDEARVESQGGEKRLDGRDTNETESEGVCCVDSPLCCAKGKKKKRHCLE